jgi:hypothetical protein
LTGAGSLITIWLPLILEQLPLEPIEFCRKQF